MLLPASYPVSSSLLTYGWASPHRSDSQAQRGIGPVYQQVLTWLLMVPLLNMVAKGSLSFIGPPLTAFDYQNAHLLRTSQGIRLPVVINLLILLGFALAGNRRIRRVLTKNPLIPMSLAFAALSALWSEAPMVTLRMCGELTLSTLFTCYLASRLSTERLMSLMMLLGCIAAALSIALALFLPRYGLFHGYGGGAWQGICNHKNTLGIGMAFLLTPAFFTSHRISVKVAYSATLLFLIAMSKSRGAWFETAGMLAFVAWLFLYKRLRSKEALLLGAFTGAVFVAFVALGAVYLEPLLRLIGKDPTLTGRTGIYVAVVESILTHPVLGYGFGAFWLGLNHESTNIALRLNWSTIGYAENGLLDLGLQVGLVGIALVAAMLFRAFRQAFRLIRSPLYNPRVGWFTAILVLELLTNVEAGWLMAAHTLDWSLTLIACIGLAKEVQRAGTLATANNESA